MKKDQLKQLETDLWSAADNLRANSDLKSSEYSTPVRGLIFPFHSAYMISESPSKNPNGISLSSPGLVQPGGIKSWGISNPKGGAPTSTPPQDHNPVGVVFLFTGFPGLLLQPRALLRNPFGIGKTATPTGFILQPEVASTKEAQAVT